jgi:hypothetical protein
MSGTPEVNGENVSVEREHKNDNKDTYRYNLGPGDHRINNCSFFYAP